MMQNKKMIQNKKMMASATSKMMPKKKLMTKEVGTNVRILMPNINNLVYFVIFDFVFSDCSFNIRTNVCSLFNGIYELKDLRTRIKEEGDLELGAERSRGEKCPTTRRPAT